MKLFKSLTACSVFAAVVGFNLPASAITFTETIEDIYTFDGETLTYNFTGLPASDGSDGTLRLFTGTGNSSFPGFDIDEAGEFFTFFIDGTNVGDFNSSGAGGVNTLPNVTQGGIDSQFDSVFAVEGDLGIASFANLVADGELLVELDFTGAVDDFNEDDNLLVELTYETASQPIPFEAEGTMGLVALGSYLYYRKKCSAKA